MLRRPSAFSQANVKLCCGRFHKMQVGGRAVPKGTTERGRPPASLLRPSAPTFVMPHCVTGRPVGDAASLTHS